MSTTVHSVTRADFARRMAEVCDLLGIADTRGRQTALGKRFGVSAKAARKWLVGDGYPDLHLAIQIAEAAGVNVNWPLQGVPPRSGSAVNGDIVTIAEAIGNMPRQARDTAIAMLEFQLAQTKGWFSAEAAARYQAALDAVRRRGGDSGEHSGNVAAA